MRAWFTGREYGPIEALRAVLRFPVGNVIAVLAARRAITAYIRVLAGGRLRWEHTVHHVHVCQATTHARSEVANERLPPLPAAA